ncbi:hypothetical protein MIND_01284400 [Mycena indigotica]|uniref:Uncharacterized protein n=1 Tax=Mycena indigotica TaxID=2126181 RepID=A0A8H6S301_9AGAR|nr:uncharacterized protein MIND_01284400 [Mycena indigotica]KAF7291398.1 hypothetical protein MIND_01284400 [Mycena indigotica]
MALSTFRRVPLEVVEHIANYTLDSVPPFGYSPLLALIKTSRVCHAAGTRVLYRAIHIGPYSPAPILETLAANVDYAKRVRSVWLFAPQRDVVPGHGDDFENRLLEAFANLTLVRALHVAHGCEDLLLGLATIPLPLLRAVHFDKFGPRAAAFIANYPQLEFVDIDYTPRHAQNLPLPFLANLSVFRGACSLAALLCHATQPLTHLQLTEEDDSHGASRVFASLDPVSTLRAVSIDHFSWDQELMGALSRAAPNLISIAVEVRDWPTHKVLEESSDDISEREAFVESVASALPTMRHLFHVDINHALHMPVDGELPRAGDSAAQFQKHMQQLDYEAAWVHRWGAAAPVLGVCTLLAARWWRLEDNTWTPMTMFTDPEMAGHVSSWTRARRTAAELIQTAAAGIRRWEEIRVGASDFARRLKGLQALQAASGQDFEVRFCV